MRIAKSVIWLLFCILLWTGFSWMSIEVTKLFDIEFSNREIFQFTTYGSIGGGAVGIVTIIKPSLIDTFKKSFLTYLILWLFYFEIFIPLLMSLAWWQETRNSSCDGNFMCFKASSNLLVDIPLFFLFLILLAPQWFFIGVISGAIGGIIFYRVHKLIFHHWLSNL
jgi:hypothetical protein